jgi:hypothetical protein
MRKIKQLAIAGVKEGSADWWLAMAIEYDEMSRQAGPFDPAYEVLKKMQVSCFNTAMKAEKLGMCVDVSEEL